MGVIADARTALASQIAKATSLRGYATWPDQVNLPCAIVGPPTGSYAADFDGSVTLVFPVTLLIAPGQFDATRAQEAIDPYLEPTGTKSIVAAVESDPSLGGKVDSAAVLSFGNYDALKDSHDVEFWGVVLQVEVYA